MNDFINILADKFARKTTSTRCAYMGKCTNCKIKSCDYMSRYKSFIIGYECALNENIIKF